MILDKQSISDPELVKFPKNLTEIPFNSTREMIPFEIKHKNL